jgi:hypothetical protein
MFTINILVTHYYNLIIFFIFFINVVNFDSFDL